MWESLTKRPGERVAGRQPRARLLTLLLLAGLPLTLVLAGCGNSDKDVANEINKLPDKCDVTEAFAHLKSGVTAKDLPPAQAKSLESAFSSFGGEAGGAVGNVSKAQTLVVDGKPAGVVIAFPLAGDDDKSDFLKGVIGGLKDDGTTGKTTEIEGHDAVSADVAGGSLVATDSGCAGVVVVSQSPSVSSAELAADLFG